MGRVLFIDTWRAGMYYTDPVVRRLSEKHTVDFLHFGSSVLRYLPSRKSESALETYKSRKQNDCYYNDIIDYGRYGRSLVHAISDIKPDVAVFISIHGLPSRWGNIVCNHLDVPTLHYMHGVKVKTEGKKTLERYLNTIYKIPRFIYYTKMYTRYVADIMHVSSDFQYKTLIEDYLELIFKHEKYDFDPTNKESINYDTLCLISDQDLEYFNENYGLNDAKKKVVGHIDIDKIIRTAQSKSNRAREGAVTFISQPLTEDRVDMSTYVKVIEALGNAVSEVGKKYIVRPHPRDDDEVISELRNRGLFVSDDNLSTDVLRSDLIIGVNSTVLMLARNLDIPIVSIDYPKTHSASFLEDYDKHKSIRYKKAVERDYIVGEVKRLLSKQRRVNVNELGSPVSAIVNEINTLC